MEPLPKKLKKKEADLTPRIMQWFVDNYPHDVAVEVKSGLNQLKTHQKAALEQVREGVFKYKIPDMGRRNPFDFIVLKKAVPVVVICNRGLCTGYTSGPKNREVFHMFKY